MKPPCKVLFWNFSCGVIRVFLFPVFVFEYMNIVFADNGVECKQSQGQVLLHLRHYIMSMHLAVKRNKMVTIYSFGFSYSCISKTRIYELNMQSFLLVRCFPEGRGINRNYTLLIVQTTLALKNSQHHKRSHQSNEMYWNCDHKVGYKLHWNVALPHFLQPLFISTLDFLWNSTTSHASHKFQPPMLLAEVWRFWLHYTLEHCHRLNRLCGEVPKA